MGIILLKSGILAVAPFNLLKVAVLIIFFIAAVPPAASQAASGAVPDAPIVIGRGINIAQWFTWPRYEPSGAGIAWPPFREEPRPPSLDDLLALERAGFETVRLPVDPAPFIIFTGKQREAVYERLFDALRLMRAAGLKTVLDIHPNSQHAVWGERSVVKGIEGHAFQSVAAFAEELARRLLGANYRATVALELLNEPRLGCRGDDQQLWQTMLDYLVSRVRAINRRLTLAVSGACVGSIDGLLALEPAAFADGPMLYTFHFYEPFSFTHQGAQFIAWPDKYLTGVPWPARLRPMGEALKRLDRNLANFESLRSAELIKARRGAAHNLKKLYRQNAGPEVMRARFAQVADWARRHGIAPAAIYNGEFGVVRGDAHRPGAHPADRLRWIRHAREAAGREGFGWTFFSYDGPFALIMDDETRRLDQGVLSALGLNSDCSRPGPVDGDENSPDPEQHCGLEATRSFIQSERAKNP